MDRLFTGVNQYSNWIKPPFFPRRRWNHMVNVRGIIPQVAWEFNGRCHFTWSDTRTIALPAVATRYPLVNCHILPWKDPPFYSWENPLFRLGHLYHCKMLVHQRVNQKKLTVGCFSWDTEHDHGIHGFDWFWLVLWLRLGNGHSTFTQYSLFGCCFQILRLANRVVGWMKSYEYVCACFSQLCGCSSIQRLELKGYYGYHSIPSLYSIHITYNIYIYVYYTYIYIYIFLGGWTSINPSYLDVNRRGGWTDPSLEGPGLFWSLTWSSRPSGISINIYRCNTYIIYIYIYIHMIIYAVCRATPPKKKLKWNSDPSAAIRFGNPNRINGPLRTR